MCLGFGDKKGCDQKNTWSHSLLCWSLDGAVVQDSLVAVRVLQKSWVGYTINYKQDVVQTGFPARESLNKEIREGVGEFPQGTILPQ